MEEEGPLKHRPYLYPLEEEMGRHQCKKEQHPTQRSIWHHQNLLVLQQEDLNILTQKKQKKMTFNMTLCS